MYTILFYLHCCAYREGWTTRTRMKNNQIVELPSPKLPAVPQQMEYDRMQLAVGARAAAAQWAGYFIVDDDNQEEDVFLFPGFCLKKCWQIRRALPTNIFPPLRQSLQVIGIAFVHAE